MHALALQALFTAGTFHLPRKAVNSSSFTWITLSPKVPEPTAPSPGSRAWANPRAMPPLPGLSLTPPAITLPLPSPSPGLAILRDYLDCGLPESAKLSLEFRMRCNKMFRELNDRPISHPGPTDRERALAQKFKRDLAIQNTVPVIPCFVVRKKPGDMSLQVCKDD